MSEDFQALRPVEKMCCKDMAGLSTEQKSLSPSRATCAHYVALISRNQFVLQDHGYETCACLALSFHWYSFNLPTEGWPG